MKSTGIVRKIDQLNRIVIPKELCRTMGLEPGTPIEIYTDGDSIVLKKHQFRCIICGEANDLEHVKGKMICKACAKRAWRAFKDG